ncbi:CocE/NonD family hydrolase [Algiphilus sp.]|uniref:CocE/NonD family hydrolase n=1 Tax=Algiphilus sp. TaxID=1872431 RepID=UPI003B521CB4
MKHTIPALALSALLALGIAGCSDSSTPSSGSGPNASGERPTTAATRWQNYERAVEYPATTAEDAFIAMRDGVQIAARIVRPTDAEGAVVAAPLPVILTINGYNSRLIGDVLPSTDFFVQRGYVHVFVDERGTGSSGGKWESFGEVAQADFLEVLQWIDSQPWSAGRVGTWGPSYMGITQFFAAKHQHPSLKAMFPIVPMGDAYRDIVFTGGQINAGFIPLWVGLVNGLGALPVAALQENPLGGVNVLLDHVTQSLLAFSAGTVSEALLGTDKVYDGPFWRARSPLEVADRVQVPTFLVGGLNDLFQRGTPLLYEALKDHTEAKLLIGPWTHLEGSFGGGLPADGVPSLDAIALQWFDRYLKGMANGAEQQPDVTQYLYGEERYVIEADWPHPEARAMTLHLRGDQSLSAEPAQAGEASNLVLQQPLNGLCSMSASQWTAGVIGLLPLPCATDNRITELLETTYTTAPLERDLYINGPIQANVWVSTTALEAGVVVRITDVYPDGRSQEITNGILTASMRAVDDSRARLLDGQSIQPWHVFTEAARQPLSPGEIVALNVEVFPSSFVIKQGHALRVSVGASDLPHGLPPLPDLVRGVAGLLTVYSDADHPSHVVLPVVDTIPAP